MQISLVRHVLCYQNVYYSTAPSQVFVGGSAVVAVAFLFCWISMYW